MNFCTTSYTFAFADADAWLEEVDWMVLHGVNLPLWPIGVEAAMADAYATLGLREDEIASFFPGPAFLGWNRMNNMDGPWSGPLRKDWRDRRANVSATALARMRELGVEPILPGFAGYVPCSLARVLPKGTRFEPRTTWNGFNSSCLIEAGQPAYDLVATAYYRSLRGLYGEAKYYSADQWNEQTPAANSTLAQLGAQSGALWRSMHANVPGATWVMQAWFLVSIAICAAYRKDPTAHPSYAYTCKNFWMREGNASTGYARVQAYLGAVPRGSLLMLDLEANQFPVWRETRSFYGQHFVHCTLHDFGQRPGIFGDLRSIASAAAHAQSASATGTFRGVGITMEGVHQNPAVYELALEAGWRGAARVVTDVVGWAEGFAQSRYGSSVDAGGAWRRLLAKPGGAYTYWDDVAQMTVSNSAFLRLELDGKKPLGPQKHTWTPRDAVADLEALRLLHAAAARARGGGVSSRSTSSTRGPGLVGDSGREERAAAALPVTLLRDLLDLLRQCLDDLLWDVARLFEGAYHRQDAAAAAAIRAAWRRLALDLDAALATDVNQLLGAWIADARATAGGTPVSAAAADADLLEYNARNQVTLWGPSGNIADYARKHWSGLVATYYVRGRWDILFDAAMNSLSSRVPVDMDAVKKATLAYEITWSKNFSETFATEPTADAFGTLSTILTKYYASAAGVLPAGYSVTRDSDVAPADFDLVPQPAWTADVGALAFLCSTDEACRGFNSHGWLKAGSFTVKNVTSSPGCDLYLKKESGGS